MGRVWLVGENSMSFLGVGTKFIDWIEKYDFIENSDYTTEIELTQKREGKKQADTL